MQFLSNLILNISTFFTSLFANSEHTQGWIYLRDTQYTEDSPLIIAKGEKIHLTNNAKSVVSSKEGWVRNLWQNNKIMPQKIKDTYTVRVDYKAKSTGSDAYTTLDLNIGGSVGNILERNSALTKSANETNILSNTNQVYALDTFFKNGGKFYVKANGGIIKIWDIKIFIERHYSEPDSNTNPLPYLLFFVLFVTILLCIFS